MAKTHMQIPKVKFNLGPLMDQRELSVDDLTFRCRAAGRPLTRTAIYNLRGSPKAVRMESLSILCEVLNVSPADLFIMEV